MVQAHGARTGPTFCSTTGRSARSSARLLRHGALSRESTKYERIMDRERGEDTFLMDETTLVPFAYTSDEWCFDRTRQNENVDYPVMFWDHETRGATERYRDFGDWFVGEVESYLFGE